MAAAAITILPTMTISSSCRVVTLPALVVGTGDPVCDRHHRFVDFLRIPQFWEDRISTTGDY
jgi:hypothetical protein